MASIQISDFPDDLYIILEAQAKRTQSSIDDVIISVLKQAISYERLEALERITERRRSIKPNPESQSSLEMLREDRERD